MWGNTAYAMLALACTVCSGPALAATCPDAGEGKRVFWGDLHIHTGYSMDAYATGARDDPASAYRFAKGATRTMPDGSEHALQRRLDFAAVTDHAELFGVMTVCTGASADDGYCREFETASDGRSRDGFLNYFLPALAGEAPAVCGRPGVDCRAAQRSLWSRSIDAAEAANEPCKFTAFVANEWTATPGALHLHRNLIYATANVPSVPVNALDEPEAADMWRALAARCTPQDDCRVLAIPHNSNLGMGGTFDIEALDDEERALRRRYERIMEIHQHKGQSECYPGSGFTDESCEFEIRLPTPLLGRETLTPTEQSQAASGYARAALAKGLLAGAAGTRNPLQLGFIGSTDTHDARPGDVEESGWPGHAGRLDNAPVARAQAAFANTNPGGLAAVWAEENTRASIFAALERRETYATSGPRIRLEVFATRDEHDWCERDGHPDDAVPMGGTVPAGKRTPVFYVRALKDRAPLVRADLVELAVTDGAVQQTIRSIHANTGTSMLCARFPDTGFAPEMPALWYARVLEQSTPRWRAGLNGSEETVQERAWSSPIWSGPGT